MRKSFCLAALLAVTALAISGCRVAAPVLEGAGGANCSNCDWQGKHKAILSEWGRDARKAERCVDHIFLNYDVNDPYRGDCLVGY